jgi:hypothetical protein
MSACERRWMITSHIQLQLRALPKGSLLQLPCCSADWGNYHKK